MLHTVNALLVLERFANQISHFAQSSPVSACVLDVLKSNARMARSVQANEKNSRVIKIINKLIWITRIFPYEEQGPRLCKSMYIVSDFSPATILIKAWFTDLH